MVSNGVGVSLQPLTLILTTVSKKNANPVFVLIYCRWSSNCHRQLVIISIAYRYESLTGQLRRIVGLQLRFGHRCWYSLEATGIFFSIGLTRLTQPIITPKNSPAGKATSGSTVSVTDTNSSDSTTGSATYRCGYDGTWSMQSGATCS